MSSRLIFFRIVILLILVVPITGCDPKCWPLCSSSSSGVATDDSSTSSTTTSSSTSSSTSSTTDDACLGTGGSTDSAITKIVLTGPNGGESYEVIGVASPISIRWDKTGTGTVCVDLYRSGEFYYRIAEDDDGYKQTATGMDWQPHKKLAESTKYQIKLSAPNDSTINDLSSNYFSITEPD